MNDQSYPQDQYFTPGGFREARHGMIAAIFVPLMIAIGQNWYTETGDKGLAISKAASLVWAWKAWAFGWVTWFFLAMFAGYWGQAIEASRWSRDGTDEWELYSFLTWVVVPLALLHVYNRLVDKSLFQQRLLYKIVRPFTRATFWIPWPVLLSLVLVPAIYAIQVRGYAETDSTPAPPRNEIEANYEPLPILDGWGNVVGWTEAPELIHRPGNAPVDTVD